MKFFKNPLIFIVEDDPTFRKLIEVHLRKEKYTNVKPFPSGEACIEHLNNSEDKPFVVIEDFDLEGGMNGLEAMIEVKKIRPEVEYIFLSGQNSIDIAVSTLKEGAFDYIIKDSAAQQNISHKLRKLTEYKGLLYDRKLSRLAIKIISTGFIALALFIFLYWVFWIKPCP